MSLRVTNTDSGPQIQCPRCAELCQPVKNTLFDEFDCPECQGTIATKELRFFLRAVRRWEENGGETSE